MIGSRLRFYVRQLREKLWIRPLTNAILAVAAVFLAHATDALPIADLVPDISAETVEKLLTVISASMLGVATFAVASMVSAYASAGSSATPRAFSLIIADGLSQTALSSFIGAFIFSIVGIIAIQVGYFSAAGRFTVFLFTLAIFAWVVLTFVRWVDGIARLGRIGNTIEKVETATREALDQWQASAPLGGQPLDSLPPGGRDLYPDKIGYIQHVDLEALQEWAEQNEARVYLRSVPGAYVDTQRALLTVASQGETDDLELDELRDSFVLDQRRTYSDDPRFGLIVLAEIGSRALSPGINDPGTAIDVIVRMSRLITDWTEARAGEDRNEPEFERVYVTPLNADDLLEDAYASITKDGVESVEVGIWLQRSLALLARAPDPGIRAAALQQARLALARAEHVLSFPYDLDRLKEAHAKVVDSPPTLAT